ncbi:MAG TPA: hypothetical protein VJ461_04685 [Candidatus Nanoarchaeia archaeon]|nr:hypothetical protein [Candidatus Nanoarchaeia archaeon]
MLLGFLDELDHEIDNSNNGCDPEEDSDKDDDDLERQAEQPKHQLEPTEHDEEGDEECKPGELLAILHQRPSDEPTNQDRQDKGQPEIHVLPPLMILLLRKNKKEEKKGRDFIILPLQRRIHPSLLLSCSPPGLS